MLSPLTLLRPLRYDRVRDVLVVQTENGARLAAIVARVRELFPGCSVHLLVREAESGLAGTLDVEQFEVARWEERFELLSRLRRHRFDAIVLQLGSGGPSELRLLPFLLRGRYLIAFNDGLDYFPMNVFRLTALANHFALVQNEAGALRALLSLLRGAVVAAVSGTVGLAWLLASVGWLHVRGWWRRRRRDDDARPARAIAGAPGAHVG